MEVTIVSKKLVKPACPTPENLRTLPISSLDQLSYSTYVPVVLYYEADDDRRQFDAEEAPPRKRQLEESLSTVLSLYYPLAGRFISEKNIIDCDDQGVELVEARVNNTKLSQLMAGTFPVHKLNLLLSYGFESPTSPLVTIQLNEFDCGGIAIGMTFAHRIMDGISMSDFIRGWSVACSLGIDKVQCPSFQLASQFPPKERFPMVRSATRKQDGVKIVTNRFLFDADAIRTLRALASSDKGGKCGFLKKNFSRVQIVTALIWVVHTRVSQAKNKVNKSMRSSLLTQPANMRDKVKIPIPQKSFGNFVIESNAKFVPKNHESDVSFNELVHILRDTIRNTITQCAEFKGADDLVAGVEDALQEGTCVSNDEVDSCRFSSWCNMEFYEADFGWGNPIWVSTVMMPRDKFTLLIDTKDKNGIEAWVNLNENDMQIFKKDPEILAFTTVTG